MSATPPPPRRYGAYEIDWFIFNTMLGLTADLLPVVSNPFGAISPKSTLKKLGKVPSQYNPRGYVVGFPGWTKYIATDKNVDTWSRHPDYGICVQTRSVRAIDVDVTDHMLAHEICAAIAEKFQGAKLPRRGRADSAKFLIPFTMPGTFAKRAIETPAGRIEFLGTGEQFVAAGTHPSGERYEWLDPPYLMIDTRDPAEFEALWGALAERFGTGRNTSTRASTAMPELGEKMRKAVYAGRDTWFEPMSDEQKVTEVRAIAATWTAEQATSRNEWLACLLAIADAVNRGLNREAGIDIAGDFSQRTIVNNLASNAEIETTMFSAGKIHNTIYVAATKAEKSGRYVIPPRRVVTPAPPPSVQPSSVLVPPDPYISQIDRTDQGNANLLIQQANGNLRHVAETKQWLRWDGKRWQIDEHEVFVNISALGVAKYYQEEAQRLKAAGREDLADTQMKWVTKCRNKTALDAMLVQARKSEGVPISVNDLDRNPWLLGVDNGVVDLRTGVLRETEAREDYVTKRCRVRYNPNATAPRWEAFITEITGAPIPAEQDANGEVIEGTVCRFTARSALARYMQKALGYSITGETREQKFFIAIGDGSNGKGVVFDTVKEILGPYAVALPSEAFLVTSRGVDAERPTALAASLTGARFVVSSETKVGQKLDIGVIKNHTGDKEMTARRMRENPITFVITHKPWLQTNVRPSIDHIDPATRGRLHLIPFDRRWNRPGEAEHNPTLPDGDKSLAAQLAGEAEGILAWLIRGVLLYQREGLTPPEEVVALTRDYILEQDALGRWLATLQPCAPKQGTLAAELLKQYDGWCRAEGLLPGLMNSNAFGRALRGRGFEPAACRDGARYGLTGGMQLHRGVDLTTVGFDKLPLPPGVVPSFIPPPPVPSTTGG